MGDLATLSPSQKPSSLVLAGPGHHYPSPLGLCRENSWGNSTQASLLPIGETNCYRLVGSVNTIGGWTANQGDTNTLMTKMETAMICTAAWLLKIHRPARAIWVGAWSDCPCCLGLQGLARAELPNASLRSEERSRLKGRPWKTNMITLAQASC